MYLYFVLQRDYMTYTFANIKVLIETFIEQFSYNVHISLLVSYYVCVGVLLELQSISCIFT